MPHTVVLVFRESPGKCPLKDWLDQLKKRERKVYAKCLALIQALETFGYELERPTSGTLRDKIYELRARHRRVNYRILYFFCGKNVACLSHGITKESEVHDIEIERAITRKRLVEGDPDRFTEDWEI